MEMQGCLWAWKIPWGISGLPLTKSNQGMKRRKNKAKKSPESGCRQDLHIPSALTFWAVNAKQALGPRYLGAGKHIPPLSLSAQGNSWLQQEPTRQILPIFWDICSLAFPCSWRKKSWQGRTDSAGGSGSPWQCKIHCSKASPGECCPWSVISSRIKHWEPISYWSAVGLEPQTASAITIRKRRGLQKFPTLIFQLHWGK